MRSHKTSLILISRLHTYRPVTVGGIRNETAAVFWPDDGVYNLFNAVHRVLRLDRLAIERDIVVNNAELF